MEEKTALSENQVKQASGGDGTGLQEITLRCPQCGSDKVE